MKKTSKITQPERWIMYLKAELPPEHFFEYDTVIFDPDNHPNLRPLVDRSKTVLASVKLNQLEKSRKYFAQAQASGLLAKSPNGQINTWIIDLRSTQWLKILLYQIIPDSLRLGFKGLLLSVVDLSPEAHVHILKIVKTIRLNYPDMKIMFQHDGGSFEALAPFIDSLLVKSLLVSCKAGKSCLRLSEQEYSVRVKQLKTISNINPHLKIFTLDHWDTSDKIAVADLYKKQRELGFVPSILDPDSEGLTVEPTQ